MKFETKMSIGGLRTGKSMQTVNANNNRNRMHFPSLSDYREEKAASSHSHTDAF
jgi:hypothetical protein